MYFVYGEDAVKYLGERDTRLGEVLARIGHIEREVDDDLFSAIVHQIIAQQISTKAQETVWRRLRDGLSAVNAGSVLSAGVPGLRSFGMSVRKAEYITDLAQRVKSGQLDIGAIEKMTDAEACAALCSLRGIGAWTAEMILIFGLQRPDVLSFGDFGIRRGLRMIYGLESLGREQFEHYRELFSPFSSVASLYLWAVSGGALPELCDPAQASDKGARK